ncbi:MAG: DNA-directed RNA polymerase subunit beta, partial [Nitrospirae bacterium]|nr:DNA-directed RNA polymerase subunit beta [Nitrospirota bacterium]
MATAQRQTLRSRKDFGTIPTIVGIPDLIAIQKDSFQRFLQLEVPPHERQDNGLQGVFTSVFPISDGSGTASIEFVEYALGEVKYDVRECLQRGMTYAAPLKIKVRLVLWNAPGDQGTRTIKDVKEQEVYLGDLPLMTDDGTFIINGTERVVVSQLHRSPGVFFSHDKGRTHASGKILFSARVIPYRGSWLDFEFDVKDILYVRIDRRRKLPASILLKALGYTNEDLLRMYYPVEEILIGKDHFMRKLNPDVLVGTKATVTITDKKTREPILKDGHKITRAALKKLESSGITEIPITREEVIGRVTPRDIVAEKTGEVILECNEKLTEEILDRIREAGISKLDLLYIDGVTVLPALRDTLLIDRVKEPKDAIEEIYRRLRPGEPPTQAMARALFDNLFFNAKRYDLSPVGRLKLNKKLGLPIPLETRVLTAKDLIEVIRYLLGLRVGKGEVDDIDHLGNRRVRSVGELLENQFRIGLVRMERAIKERMSIQDLENILPHDLINAKPVTAAVKEFFGSSQLSQFLDQTNPLAEITHKRRLSALGPGGLTRERAGFEVRDVHPTHYGRICPIETPEGPNIGLITSLATYGRVNEFGFIEAPYRKVHNGTATDEIIYLSAIEGEQYVIAQANTPVDDNGRITTKSVSVRVGGDFRIVTPAQADFMDISPKQMVSVSAALIPFLENDDANRALMGS